MQRAINFLSWCLIGGTLSVNNIHWNSVSFWVILVCVMAAENTANSK